MPLDPDIVGRTYPPAPPHEVTADAVRAFVEATGATYDGGPAPATYPIVPAFAAMAGFLDAEALDLSRIVHGAQGFRHERPVVPGDVLTVTLTVASLRSIGGNDVVGTTSRVVDAAGELVSTGTATLVHRGAEGDA